MIFKSLKAKCSQSFFDTSRNHLHLVEAYGRAEWKRDNLVRRFSRLRVAVPAQANRKRKEGTCIDAAAPQVIAHFVTHGGRKPNGKMTLREGVAPGTAHDAGLHQALGIDLCLVASKLGVLPGGTKIVQGKSSIQISRRPSPFWRQSVSFLAWSELQGGSTGCRSPTLLISQGTNGFVKAIKMAFMRHPVKVPLIHCNPKQGRTTVP